VLQFVLIVKHTPINKDVAPTKNGFLHRFSHSRKAGQDQYGVTQKGVSHVLFLRPTNTVKWPNRASRDKEETTYIVHSVIHRSEMANISAPTKEKKTIYFGATPEYAGDE
jgi:hypothetical protein